jgi:hypothetical protein
MDWSLLLAEVFPRAFGSYEEGIALRLVHPKVNVAIRKSKFWKIFVQEREDLVYKTILQHHRVDKQKMIDALHSWKYYKFYRRYLQSLSRPPRAFITHDVSCSLWWFKIPESQDMSVQLHAFNSYTHCVEVAWDVTVLTDDIQIRFTHCQTLVPSRVVTQQRPIV